MMTYPEALAAHNKAYAEFKIVRDAYRALKVDDAEFLAAKKKYDDATYQYDKAYEEETK